jgi:hypothetical protein
VTDIPQVEFNVGTGSDLYPGGPSQPINFTISNPGTSSAYVNQVTITIPTETNGDAETQGGSDIPGCLASWFTISGSPSTVHQNILPGASLNWSGTASISMPADSIDNQDACEGASIGLTFTSD